jgi:sulfotransferase family protein
MTVSKTDFSVTFPNWQSRWLLRGLARSQPLRPVEFPAWLEGALGWYERHVLGVDVRRIGIDRPIFLLGTPRSGTTMLQDILCSHESVAYVNNTMHRYPTTFCVIEHYRRALALDFEADRYLHDSVRVSAGSPSDAIGFWADAFGLDLFSLEYHDLPGGLSADRIARMKDTIRRYIWCYGTPYRRFFIKLLAVVQYTHVLRDIFPDAKFIHILRDARFVANSMVKHCQLELQHQRAHYGGEKDPPRLFIPYPRFPKTTAYVEQFGLEDVRTTAHIWNDVIAYLDGVKASIPHYCEVRFEDIVAAPAERIGALLEFCELPPARANNTLFWNKVGGIGAVSHTNRYRNLEQIEEICHENLQKHGYLS